MGFFDLESLPFFWRARLESHCRIFFVAIVNAFDSGFGFELEFDFGSCSVVAEMLLNPSEV